MRCGAKCFVVEFEINGEKQVKEIIARTSVEARKTIRLEYGTSPQSLSVKEREKVSRTLMNRSKNNCV